MADTPEREMIQKMWNGKDVPPVTAAPEVIKTKSGSKTFLCNVWCIHRLPDRSSETKISMVQSWDFEVLSGNVKNGPRLRAPHIWKVYDGEALTLQEGDTLKINAMRIGHKAAVAEYVNGVLVKR